MQPAFTFPAQQYFQVFHVTSKSYSKVLRVPSHGLQISLICRPWLRILKQNEDEVLGLKVWTICEMWPITTVGITWNWAKLWVRITGWRTLCIGWVYKLGFKIILDNGRTQWPSKEIFAQSSLVFRPVKTTRETMGKKWTNPCVIFY